MNNTTLTEGQVITFEYDLPSRYHKEKRGRKRGDFEIKEIIPNPVVRNSTLVYMKPLDDHFHQEYPNTPEIWAHLDNLLSRIAECESE